MSSLASPARMSLKDVRGWCSLQRAEPAASRERMQFQEGPNQSESSEGPPVCSGLVWVWRSATWRHTSISCLGGARRDPSYDLTGQPTGLGARSSLGLERSEEKSDRDGRVTG